MPIHQPGHWCLAVLHMTRCELEYYDSFSRQPAAVTTVAQDLLCFFDALFKERNHHPLRPPISWRVIQPDSRPLQTNGVDCGVFVCAYARCRSSREFNEFNFTARDISRIRRKMQKKLLRQEPLSRSSGRKLCELCSSTR
jgi:Ulp1 family protease